MAVEKLLGCQELSAGYIGAETWLKVDRGSPNHYMSLDPYVLWLISVCVWYKRRVLVKGLVDVCVQVCGYRCNVSWEIAPEPEESKTFLNHSVREMTMAMGSWLTTHASIRPRIPKGFGFHFHEQAVKTRQIAFIFYVRNSYQLKSSGAFLIVCWFLYSPSRRLIFTAVQ